MLFLGRVITLYKRRGNDSGANYRLIEIDGKEVKIYKYGQSGSNGTTSPAKLIEVRPIEKFDLRKYCKHGGWRVCRKTKTKSGISVYDIDVSIPYR